MHRFFFARYSSSTSYFTGFGRRRSIDWSITVGEKKRKEGPSNKNDHSAQSAKIEIQNKPQNQMEGKKYYQES